MPGAAACATPALATTFSFNDFSSVANLTINGNAGQVGNTLQLTPPTTGQSGSAFSTVQATLGSNASFSTLFSFQITSNGSFGDADGPGADGIVFVLQTQANNVGGAGGGIGYSGIAPSVGVEFDTYDNGGPADPNGNHVGIDVNGNVSSVATATSPGRFNDGQVWFVWVDFNGATNTLETRWSTSSARPAAAQLTSVQNIAGILGQTSAFVGFTAGTGAGFGDQRILSWQFRDSFNPIGNTAPEPGTLVLLGAAFGAFALRRRQRRH